jgi:hypothetical protein
MVKSPLSGKYLPFPPQWKVSLVENFPMENFTGDNSPMKNFSCRKSPPPPPVKKNRELQVCCKYLWKIPPKHFHM